MLGLGKGGREMVSQVNVLFLSACISETPPETLEKEEDRSWTVFFKGSWGIPSRTLVPSGTVSTHYERSPTLPPMGRDMVSISNIQIWNSLMVKPVRGAGSLSGSFDDTDQHHHCPPGTQ